MLTELPPKPDVGCSIKLRKITAGVACDDRFVENNIFKED
jgi:hypothetical protein